MIRKFASDKRGNFSMMMVVATIPILGGIALAVDYAELSRQRQLTLNALDAASVATGAHIVSGAVSTADPAAYEAAIKKYAKDFFEANLGPVNPANTVLTVVLPNNNAGGGTLKLTAGLTYQPYFLPAFTKLIGRPREKETVDVKAQSEVRLKNTLEVALVLDNSGSMDYVGGGSGKKRLELLKEAAKQLVDAIAKQGVMMKQVADPVRFSVVPFAASVNVGPENWNAPWMDTTALSPVHYENFDKPSSVNINGDSNKRIECTGGVCYKKGSAWPAAQLNQMITRFTLYDDLRVKATSDSTATKFTSWAGCVEARPSPYNNDNTTPTTTNPATLFVPMFAPDETDLTDGSWQKPAYNNWWNDKSDLSNTTANNKARQRGLAKYYTSKVGTAMGAGEGPNDSCTTKAITPLTNVTNAEGLTKIKTAIDDMIARGATNVPEGMAWGWRTVSGSEPFTQGRGDNEKGNDKVVIVLTDGENTYYPPTDLWAHEYSGTHYDNFANDLAGNKSTYSAHGYVGQGYDGTTTPRIFKDTTVSTSTYTRPNYTAAMNQHFKVLCTNAKDKNQGNIIVMTVALDLNATKPVEKDQIDALKACASGSRFTTEPDPNDATKTIPKKLFWNTTGGDLEKTFKEIADELSNLRIVG
jgi:Flp pilus assembly protein TadG